jgi:apolipoprotein D and lipocalin family protein
MRIRGKCEHIVIVSFLLSINTILYYYKNQKTPSPNHFDQSLNMGNIVGGSAGASKLPPLTPAPSCDTAKFMGTWFVIAVKPTMFEKHNSNAVEKYTWVKDKGYDINIDFTYNKAETPDSPLSSLPQKGWIQGPNKDNSSLWKVSPLWPIKMPYLILEVQEDDYTIIGYPNREYCWIMGRKPIMADDTYEQCTQLLQTKHQYDLQGLRKVPQIWTREEREKRGLTQAEIPDDMLVKE